MDEVKGYITLGPKEKPMYCIPVPYIPKKFQIWMLRLFYGWDFITKEEYIDYMNKKWEKQEQ